MLQGFNVHEFLKIQMMMGLVNSVGGNTALYNIIFLNLYEKLVQNYSTWFPELKVFCCRRQKNQPATSLPPANREIKCTI